MSEPLVTPVQLSMVTNCSQNEILNKEVETENCEIAAKTFEHTFRGMENGLCGKQAQEGFLKAHTNMSFHSQDL